MIKNGLGKVRAHTTDYSLIPTFGALATTEGLPADFSIYDGRPIPDQEIQDGRFTPAVRPLPMGCTAESTTFMAGLEDNCLYRPDLFYFATPPGTDGAGRDIRTALSTAKNWGLDKGDGVKVKKGDYYNCYGTGNIDDFDAVQIALWINQNEKRSVTVGSWFYQQWYKYSGIVPTPSFNTKEASLHNWIVTGWKTINGVVYLEALTWQGQIIQYFSREIFNALMAQPYTGAFTQAATPTTGPISVGYTAIIDHLVAFIYQLYHNFAH